MKSTNPAFSSANADADLPANAAPRAIVSRPVCVRVCSQRRSRLLPEAFVSAPRGVRICSQRRPRLLPEASASAPRSGCINSQRRLRLLPRSSISIGNKSGATIPPPPSAAIRNMGQLCFLENKNPVNPQPFILLRIYRICVLRISLGCTLRINLRC